MDLVWLLVVVVVLFITGSAAWAGLRAAPYLPTRQKDVERMLRLANIQPGELVYDLGAGDGRFIISAAKNFKARGVGYEISFIPWLVGKIRLARARTGGDVQLRFQDFFHVDLSAANVVVCFLTPPAMAKLAPKFRTELKPGTRIISYAFALPGFEPKLKDKPTPTTMAVFVYQV
jgi:SAM-dependent methyltransferase